MWMLLGSAVASGLSNMSKSRAQAIVNSGMLKVKAIEANTMAIAAQSNSELSALRAKTQKSSAQLAASRARLQGKLQVIGMRSNFNKTMATNAVIAAAQGRSGGSVAQIASAAEKQLDWDIDLAKMDSEIQAIESVKNGYASNTEAFNYQMQALGYGSSAKSYSLSSGYSKSSANSQALQSFVSDVGTKMLSSGAFESTSLLSKGE